MTLPKKNNGFCKCGSLMKPSKDGALCPKCDKAKLKEIKKEEKKKSRKKESSKRRSWKRDDSKGYVVSWKHRTGVVYGLVKTTDASENGGKSSYMVTLMSDDGKKKVSIGSFTRKKLAIRDMRKNVNSEVNTVGLLSKIK